MIEKGATGKNLKSGKTCTAIGFTNIIRDFCFLNIHDLLQ